MAEVRYAASAEADIHDVWDYLARHDVGTAIAFIRNIRRLFQHIAQNPHMGRTRSDVAPGMRQMIHDRYRILYTPAEYGAKVYRVMHVRRDAERLRMHASE